MIKFFKKIRYDLMEKNKTGKYFKYAIGKIVHVVIGSLLPKVLILGTRKGKIPLKKLPS